MPNLRISKEDSGVMTIRLDVPGRPVNVLTQELFRELKGAIAAAERNGASGIVLASAKERSFAAGADLKALMSMTRAERDVFLLSGREVMLKLERSPLRSVAAIDGTALGGGLELALACRWRICTPASVLGLPEIRLGLIPGWGGTVRLTEAVGGERAVEMLFSGENVTAAEAERIGLVQRVVQADRLMAAADELLRQATVEPRAYPVSLPPLEGLDNGTRAARRMKEVLEVGQKEGRAAQLEVQRHALLDLLESPEAKMAIEAFLSRRRK